MLNTFIANVCVFLQNLLENVGQLSCVSSHIIDDVLLATLYLDAV